MTISRKVASVVLLLIASVAGCDVPTGSTVPAAEPKPSAKELGDLWLKQHAAFRKAIAELPVAGLVDSVHVDGSGAVVRMKPAWRPKQHAVRLEGVELIVEQWEAIDGDAPIRIEDETGALAGGLHKGKYAYAVE